MKDRRKFLQGAGAGLLTASSLKNVPGANDRVRVGFIGIGLIGKRHLLDFLAMPDAEVAAISEVYDPRLEEGIATAAEKQGRKPDGFKDFRRMYERKDIDAIVVSTPDHWHTLLTIMACAAGKDVYVEKPLTLFVREGRWMIDAAKRYKRIVQVGTQQRSGEQYNQCVELIRNGHIGEVRNIRIASFRNIMPGFTKPVGAKPMDEKDWRMWLGPAPARPFDANRGIYHFRWFWDYSGGQMTNWGAHNLDIARWALKAKAPSAVAAFGGRYAIKDGGETPDTQEVIYQFPDCVVTWSGREVNRTRDEYLAFHGTKGTLSILRNGFTIAPEIWKPMRKSPDTPQMQAMNVKAESGDATPQHVRNFLDCVKSRQRPKADVEEGHLTANVCHLGNIATRLGRSLKWDAEKEIFIGDKEASQMLSRPYRKPWKLE
jgi:predicted dehydrogenase